MNLAKARRLMAACVLPAAAIAALAGPSAASAFFAPEPPLHCEGESVKGQGSSLQEFAQHNEWIPGFAGECPSEGITYTVSSSGLGLESWGVETSKASNFTNTNAFVGTDNAPDQLQKEEIELQETAKTGKGKVETLPVLQAAVAIIVHLPTGCTAVSSKKPKKPWLRLSNAKLEAIFEGKQTWAGLNGENANKLKCKGKAAKAAENGVIKRVVRLEGSGTTAITDKYLELNPATKGKKVINGTTTWNQEAQLGNNTEWPNNSGTEAVIRAKGSGKVVSEVAANPGTIGYVNLANARSTFGGATPGLFWVELENNPGSFASPSSDGLTTVAAKSNCEQENYTNGIASFPPLSTEEPWNEVTTAYSEPHYTLCGLTYDIAPEVYEGYATSGAFEARSVHDYLGYVTGAAGQATIGANGTDYEALTGLIDGIAAKGAKAITFEPEP
jgi:ABC-type phosphate transport system substrate-binding protein